MGPVSVALQFLFWQKYIQKLVLNQAIIEIAMVTKNWKMSSD